MLKPILIGAATFVVLCAGFYVVLTNSHIDIFPGIETQRNFETNKLERREGAVSLLDVSRGIDRDGEGAELMAMGYVVEMLVVVVLPLILGAVVAFIVFRAGGRKSARAQAPPAE